MPDLNPTSLQDPTAAGISQALAGDTSALNSLTLTPEQADATKKDLAQAQTEEKRVAQKEEQAAGQTFNEPAPQQPNVLSGLSPLLLFAAFGGGKMKGNANAMLGATSGVVQGYLSGSEEKYQQAVDAYKQRFEQFKEHYEQQQKIYKEMREAYKGRIDADIKALQFARQVTGDSAKIDQHALDIQERMDQQFDKLQAQVKHWTNQDNVAQTKVDLQKKKANADAAGGKALDDKAVDLLAQQYIDTGKLPGFGMGKNGQVARVQVLDRAAQILDQSGDNEKSMLVRQASVKAAQSALTDQGKKRSAMASAEQTASANLDLAVQEGQKTDRVGSPMVNRAIIAWRQGVTGDPQTARFVNALTTAKNEYAKVISGATGASGITDAARKEADDLFSKVTNQQTLEATVALAKKEMKNRMAGFDQTMGQLKATIGDQGNTSPPGNSAATTAPTEGQKATSKSGRPIVLQNGQWVYVQ
jgi:hypothetical protein